MLKSIKNHSSKENCVSAKTNFFSFLHNPRFVSSFKLKANLLQNKNSYIMKLRFIFGFLFISSALWSSPDQSIIGEDEFKPRNEKGQKHGKWVIFGKDKPDKGFPSDGKIEEGNYLEDRKEGKWTKYHNDGETPKLIGTYKNNRPEGPYEKIGPNGIVIEKGTFVRGKYMDSLSRYHPNGVAMYEGYYDKDGNEDGKITYRYPNGQVEFEYESANGVPTGKAVRYYENGDIKEIIQYSADGVVLNSEKKEMVNPAVKIEETGPKKEGAPKVSNPITKNGDTFKPNGYNKIYNANEEIWQDGDFKNGRLWNGKVYEYDEDGILLKVKVFKNGAYHSDGQL